MVFLSQYTQVQQKADHETLIKYNQMTFHRISMKQLGNWLAIGVPAVKAVFSLAIFSRS